MNLNANLRNTRKHLVGTVVHSFHPNGSEFEQTTKTWQNVEDGPWLEVRRSERFPGSLSCLLSFLLLPCYASCLL